MGKYQNAFVLICSLTKSRASRILWILEELGLDYEVKVYQRTPQFLAPKELLEVWPTGVSPILLVYRDGSSEPYQVAESGHIASYLVRNYDTKGVLTPDTKDDAELVDYYLHFAEGSLQPHLVSMLVGNVAQNSAPWPANYFVGAVVSKMNAGYYIKRLVRNLKFLDQQLEKKGGGYFVGNKLSAADIILAFPINENLFNNQERMNAMGLGVNLNEDFPNLYKWHQLIEKEVGRSRAQEKEKSLDQATPKI